MEHFLNLDCEPDCIRPRAHVLEWNDDRDFGVVAGDDGKRRVVIASDIQPDSLGRRYLLPGELVAYSPSPERGDKAVAVAPLSRPLFERIAPDYFEDCFVTRWSPERGYGFARRPQGGQIRFCVGDIISPGIEDLGLPGARIRCGFRYDANMRNFVAKDVLIFEPEPTPIAAAKNLEIPLTALKDALGKAGFAA